MKPSLYNIKVEETENGNHLYFNSYTGAFVELEDEYEYILNNLQIENSEDFDQEKLKELNSVGFVVEDDFDERVHMKHMRNIAKYSNDTLGLTIAPTMNCNMNCSYCYESKSTKRMSEETEDEIIKFIDKKISQGVKRISVVWYGGEPTLEFERIKTLSRKMIDVCKEKDINYSAGMISNGYLLDKFKAKTFGEECKIDHVQITLDGLEEVHNKSRVLVNGEDSFKTIIENIKHIRNYMNVSIRYNVSNTNKKEVMDLFEYLEDELSISKDRNINMYIAPVTDCQEACNISEDELVEFEDFSKIYEEFFGISMKNQNVEEHKNRYYPIPRAVSCMAETINGFVLGPEGELYKCYHEVGLEDRVIGTVKNIDSRNKVMLDYVETEIPEECGRCSYIPVCQGGCLSVRLKNKNKPSCYVTREQIIEKLKKTYNIFYKNN